MGKTVGKIALVALLPRNDKTTQMSLRAIKDGVAILHTVNNILS